MKKHLLILLILGLPFLSFSQNTDKAQKLDTAEIIKKGWNFGPLPVVGYNSDLGFNYGACIDIFNFGDGSNYPNFNYKFNVELSTYTKGSSTMRFYSVMNNVLPKTKMFVDVAYFIDKKFGFSGFNGYRQFYDKDITVYNDPILPIDHTTKSGFNFFSRRQFRLVASIKRPLTERFPHLFYAFGLAYFNNSFDRIDVSGYDDQTTLFDLYCANNLIHKDELNGNVTQFKAGFILDTRDHESDPHRGLYSELVFTAAPDLIDGHGYDNLSMTAILSGFTSIIHDHVTLAMRIGTQNVLAGDVPFHSMMNTNLFFYTKMTTDALGGSNSVRGINPNSVIGKGFTWANVEIRCRLYSFKLINQNWTIGINPFFDAGTVSQLFRDKEQKAAIVHISDEYPDLINSGKDEGIHTSAGMGLKIIMNHNFIVSADFAKALDSRDGNDMKAYIGFAYIF